jgi:hypothetical protein
MGLKMTVWIIADTHRKIVAVGSPRNRRLNYVDKLKERVLTYGTRSKAQLGITMSGFYTHDCADYIQETYGYGRFRIPFEKFLEPVECALSEVDSIVIE